MAIDFTRDILLEWPEAHAPPAALLREGGVTPVAAGAIHAVPLAELERQSPDAVVALKSEVWPGIARDPAVKDRGDETASASREPWVDANGYWIPYLRALYPKRPALLAASPPASRDRMTPFDTLELALVEARMWGGNCLLTPDGRYREALVAGDAKALEAWRAFARTARWLGRHQDKFLQPALPILTAVVEPGETTAEIANLLFRWNASPALVPAAALPAAAGLRCLALVAADLKSPDFAALTAHAQAGATVVVTGYKASGRKPDRSEPDRDFFAAGRGRIVSYRETIADPSEFALDVIDLIGHKQRAVRLWNAPAVIARVTTGGFLHLVNYGSPVEAEFPVRVQGVFARATFERPEHPPAALKTARRGSTTEVVLSGIRRAALVAFQ